MERMNYEKQECSPLRDVRFRVFPLCSESSQAQQKKGDKEVLLFSNGFFFDFGGDTKLNTAKSDPFTSGSFFSSSSSQGFNIGGEVGYFLTRKHEVGGGPFLSVDHFSFCQQDFVGSELTGKTCSSDTQVGLGLTGLYRYNFAKAEARGFPFVGGTISVSDVTRNFTGNVRARPHAGYKYFVKKNVALDFSVGYLIEVNKVNNDSLFITDRRHSIDGQLGLSFVF
jgi:hypothetical protein